MGVAAAAAATPTWLVPHPSSSSSTHPFAAARVRRLSTLEAVHGIRLKAIFRGTVCRAASFESPVVAAVEECSVTRAFSSTVFIIREVQSFALRLREVIFGQDLGELIGHVREELHCSFTWLFQCVFSRTPALMLCLMLLLANFTVHSIHHLPPVGYVAAADVTVIPATSPGLKIRSLRPPGKFSNFGEELVFGGGGGRHRPVHGATADGGDGLEFRRRRRMLFDEGDSEARLWEAMVEEVASMSPAVDQEIIQMMVSPVRVEMPDDDYSDYLRSELCYYIATAQDPNNPLLLCNFAQFLYLVQHDHTRAEEYFKRAAAVRPPDAAALASYAGFLWTVRGDVTAAEEMYLEAIAAEPGNTHYAASYANFLWNTGGEDTCFPLADADDDRKCTGEFEE